VTDADAPSPFAVPCVAANDDVATGVDLKVPQSLLLEQFGGTLGCPPLDERPAGR